MSVRLSIALDGWDVSLPDAGDIAVLRPPVEADLSRLPTEAVRIVHSVKPAFDHFARQGFRCESEWAGGAAMTVVCLPRAKALARALIARANDQTEAMVVVDGSKTDGIDSALKDVRKRVAVQGPVSKAHGKLFWFAPEPGIFSDWDLPETTRVGEFVTAPGVFSADGVDPASEVLADTLPAKLGRHVADLGAGWGYLSARVLERPEVETLDLVEADKTALDCARVNVPDARARFHWADATDWHPDERLDCVVMNPPFHTGRAATPSLGQAFIDTAARSLKPSGQLWMVANRHLPYEARLAERFRDVEEAGGNTRFKILHAGRPRP